MASPQHPRGPLFELTSARVREALRDPVALFWTFGFPVLVAVALGFAFRTAPPRPEAIGIACTASTSACDLLRTKLAARSDLSARELALPNALVELRRGMLDLVLELGPDPNASPRLVYHYDASRPEARTARLAAQAAVDEHRAVFESRDQLHAERGARYIDYLMPGIVALNLMGSGIWGIGLAIVDTRRRNLMRRLATTPMKRSHFLLSFAFSRLVFLLPEVVFLFGFGVLAFGTMVRGSLLSVGVLSLVGAAAFTAIGLLIAARTSSAEAAGGLANLAMMPMWLCSGVFFRYDQFPSAFQPAIRALPLTALSDALRAVTNEGANLADCAAQLAVLGAWGVIAFVLALRLLRWT